MYGFYKRGTERDRIQYLHRELCAKVPRVLMELLEAGSQKSIL